MRSSFLNDRDHLVWKNYGNYAGNIPERESKKWESIPESGIDYQGGFDFREQNSRMVVV